jgi:hypothetical protein
MIFQHTCQGEVEDQVNDEANQREERVNLGRVLYDQPPPKCNKTVAKSISISDKAASN